MRLSLQPLLAKPLPSLAGLAVSLSLATTWILYVTHLVNTSTVPGTSAHWVSRARHEAYGVCYDGCDDDCLDVGKIEDACAVTAEPQIPDFICDASKMWFWADRYPDECLLAVGALFKEKELRGKRFRLRFLYLLTALAALAGYGAYKGVDYLAPRVGAYRRRRREARAAARGRHEDDGRRTSATTPLLRATTATTALVSVLLFSVNVVEAYPCTSHHAVYNQPFVSISDPTLFGNIHGWLSNCYTERYACGETCEDDDNHDCGDEKGHTRRKCTTDYCDRERADTSPAEYVRRAGELVKGCGFKMVDYVPGVVDRRIANPRIEGTLWARIGVNRYNGSEGVERGVRCLGDVVAWPGEGGGRRKGLGMGERFRFGF
ncbi:hypothetical protein GE09DRAFT_460145 [Coniochaeta sp. 2T2.1]|nr:hypothetical protein GE09DRAFT_460145 [Coniochaeta sp. 2T2.1]